jgi:AraC-like DNA-binding protein/predicted negative regulator of RcsB-dependent stress response
MQLGNKDAAIRNYNEALDIHYKTGNKVGEASILINLSIVYLADSIYDKALKNVEKSRNIFESLEQKRDVAETYIFSGDIYFQKKEYQQAIDHYQKAEKLNAEIHNLNNQVLALFSMGKTYNEIGNYDAAISCFKKSKNISPKDFYPVYPDIYLGFSNAYFGLKEYKKSREFYEQFVSCKDSIYTEKTHLQITELQTKYETEKKEREIDALKMEKKLYEEREKLKEQLLSLTLLTSILILVSSIVFFLQKEREKKKNRELVRKNLEAVKNEEKLKKMNEFLQEKNIPSNLNNYEKPKSASSPLLSESHKQEIIARMMQLLEKEKIFLQTDLTLDKLSKELNTNKTYVSHIINNEFQTSFIQFINEFRIKEARKRLSDPKNRNFTIEAIAHDSGFTSVKTFNNNFKRITGVTPSIYLKNLPDQTE